MCFERATFSRTFFYRCLCFHQRLQWDAPSLVKLEKKGASCPKNLFKKNCRPLLQTLHYDNYNAWWNKARRTVRVNGKTVCCHLGFNNHVIFQIWPVFFAIRTWLCYLFKCCNHMEKKLRVRKRKCVLAKNRCCHVTESSRLKSKRKMWTKDRKMEQDKFSHLPLLEELRGNNPDDF
jgi:hypothetical protein